MKPTQKFDLGPLRLAREKHDALARKKTELEETKVELEGAIEADKKSGAFDDSEVVARLSSNKSRVEMIPARIAQLDAQIRKVAEEVQQQFSLAVYFVADCYRSIYNEHEQRVRDFLGELLVPEHKISGFVREIVPLAPAVQQAEAVKNSFSLPSVQRDSSLIFSMASRAEELISKWQAEQ